MSIVNSIKGIYSEWGLRTDTYENYISGTHTTQPLSLVLVVVPIVTDSHECLSLMETACRASNPSKESILSEVFVSTLMRTTSRGPALCIIILLWPKVKCFTKVLRVMDLHENIEGDGNYMTGDNIFKGSTLSEILVPTLMRTTSREPALLNLVITHVFTLDLGRESFPQSLQSE